MADETTSPAFNDADFAEPKVGKFNFNKVGDFIKGKYMGSKPFDGTYGPTIIHSVEAEAGVWHDEESGAEITLTPGEVYSFFEKPVFADQISKAQVGQRVLLSFDEEKKSQNNGKMYKLIKCKLDTKFVAPSDDPFAG